MRYSTPLKTILCVSLAFILCFSMFAQEVFLGWASDDSLGASGEGAAVGYSLGVSKAGGTIDAHDLRFEFPEATYLSGVYLDPLAGVKVINDAAETEAEKDVTLEFNIEVTNNGGCNFESPAAGTYTLTYRAQYPGNILLTLIDQREITVEEFGGDAYVRLSDGSEIHVGGESYLNMTANLDTGATQGRYIVIRAQQDAGFRFDLDNVKKIDDIDEIDYLNGDPQTLLLTVNEKAESIITMDFPLRQTITRAISETGLNANTKFAFSAELYVGLSDLPEDPKDAKDTHSIEIGLAEYKETTISIRRTSKTIGTKSYSDYLDIDNYNTSMARDGALSMEEFRLNLEKAVGMRSSYELELIIPVDSRLQPVASGNVDVSEYKGEPCFIIPVTNASLLNAALDPEASYTHSGTSAIFSFTPQFSNLDGLAKDIYEAQNPITLRIHQYGDTYEQVLANDPDDVRNTNKDSCFYFLFNNSSYIDPTLKYYTTPAQVIMNAGTQMVDVRPDYTKLDERPYDDLQVTFYMPTTSGGPNITIPDGRIMPQSLVLGADYGPAKVGYKLSNGGGKAPALLQPGDPLVFEGISPDRWVGSTWTRGVHVSEIYYEPVKLDTTLSDKGFAFHLYCDFTNVRSADGVELSVAQSNHTITYALTSKNFDKNLQNAVTVEKSFVITANMDGYRWDYATIALNEYISNSDQTTKNYYLENRPAGDQSVAYLHYTYRQRVGEKTFNWVIQPESGGTHAEFLRSLTAIQATPSATGPSSPSYLTRFSVTYTTDQHPGARTEEFSGDVRGQIFRFDFAGPGDFLTSLSINYTTSDWTNYSVSTTNPSTTTLFAMMMDLNKYKEVTGQDLPSIQAGAKTLAIGSTITVEGISTPQTLNGRAGTFIWEREPYWISGSNLQISQSKTSAQGGDEIRFTLSRLLNTHTSATNIKNVNGERMVLSNMTTYIPIDNNFYYVEGSVDVYPSNATADYKTGDLVYSTEFIRGSGTDTSWLVIHWDTFTTGGQSDGSYRNDPTVQFSVRSSPLITSDTHKVIAGSVYNDVGAASQNNNYYVYTVVGDRHTGTLPNYAGSPNFTLMTKGSGNSNVRILAAATYGIQLFGGIDDLVYEAYIPYLNHEKIQGIVKMNYKSGREGGGEEDGVAYVEIPRGSGAHPGLRLTKAVDISKLPPDSSVAYSVKANPNMMMLSDWDDDDEDFSETLPANPADVTYVRIVGVNLNETVRLAYVPLANRTDKEIVGQQTLALSAMVAYKSNASAQKAETIFWELEDYTVTGVFWDDADTYDGTMLGKTGIGGTITAQKMGGRVYPTATVSATGGYSLAVPSYGNYTFTALSSGYVISNTGPDNLFAADGTRTVNINANHMAVNAGFRADNADQVVVVFVTNGGQPVPEPQKGYVDQLIQEPTPPTKDGVEFDGWYLGDASGKPFADAKKWQFQTDTIHEDYRHKVMYLVAEWSGDSATKIDVSDIDFGTKKIPMEPTIYDRFHPDTLTLNITNAPAGTWSMTVKCVDQFTLLLDDGTKDPAYVMPYDALIYREKGSASYKGLEQAYPIIVGSTERNVTKVWENGSGILAIVAPDTIHKEGKYQATIEWNITNGSF